jgi:hypothetical protein
MTPTMDTTTAKTLQGGTAPQSSVQPIWWGVQVDRQPLGSLATGFRLWAPIQVTQSNQHTFSSSAAVVLQPMLLAGQRPAPTTTRFAYTAWRKTTGLLLVGRQVTLLWTCLTRRLIQITLPRDRVMRMAVAKGKTTDKTPVPTQSM